MKTIVSDFYTSRICPLNPKTILKEILMPSDDATITINQVQPATPSYKLAEQNLVKKPTTLQVFSTLPGGCQNPLVSTGLILLDLAEILQPAKYDEKSKPPRVTIEECLLTEDYWREKELCLIYFHKRKEIRKK